MHRESYISCFFYVLTPSVFAFGESTSLEREASDTSSVKRRLTERGVHSAVGSADCPMAVFSAQIQRFSLFCFFIKSIYKSKKMWYNIHRII